MKPPQILSPCVPADLSAPLFPDLARFFTPRSVALLGATEDQSKFGGRCMRKMIDFGFTGEIMPVNPRRDTILGRPCYASIAELPQAPDHVGIILPAEAVPQALEQCAERGVRFATVFSSGFAEGGSPEGRKLEQRVREIARAGGVRVMGPNCNGLVNFVDGFWMASSVTIQGDDPRPAGGDLAVASQSGGAGLVNVVWRAQHAGLGISYQVSCGNCADLDLLDYAAWMVESEATRVVMVIAERQFDGAKLRALAERAAELEKPIVMVKLGRTETGARAAASHTGALTGNDAVCDAALAQLGVIRVSDYNDLYETAMLLRRRRIPAGARIASTSFSGGNLVMMADQAARRGLEWPSYAEATQQQLQECLPGFGAATNPTDLTGAAIGHDGRFTAAVRAIVSDPNVDVVVPALTFVNKFELNALAALSTESEKPIAFMWGGCAIDDASLTPERLVAQGHAVYRDAEPCIKAISAAVRYGSFLRGRRRGPPQRPAGMDVLAARAVLAGAQGTLSEHRSKALLAAYGFMLSREFLATTVQEAVQHAQAIGGRVALKVQSPQLPHKTEAGALALNVDANDAEAVREAHARIVRSAQAYRPDAQVEGVLVQEMVQGGTEMLLGIARDESFGPVIAIGLGGIHVETLKDVAYRLAPLGPDAALEALQELRGFPILEGVRGRPAADIGALADSITRLSWLAVDLADSIVELDINPLCVLHKGACAVDALAVLAAPGDSA